MARAVKLLSVAAGLGLVAAIAWAMLAPSSAPAQKPAAVPGPELPEGYVGAETCKGCHEAQWDKFARTKMGRLFLNNPRNGQERLACENCHGPGKANVEAGCAKGKRGLNTFA